ncbi:unnamed protein product, partial [Vitis vinifera]
MAPNKFATMLHMNTHKITVILVYAVLEWLLIILLLLNSFLFYFISKFAAYFGLKPPCLWCCCCDHLFTTKFCPPYFLFKPSWNILEYSRKGNLIVEEMHSEIYGDDFSDNCENQSEMKHNVEADVGNDQVLANEQLIVSGTMSKELESLEMGAIEDSVALNTGDGRNEDLVDKACEQSITSQAAQNVSTDTNDREAKAMKEPDDPTGINNLLYSLHFGESINFAEENQQGIKLHLSLCSEACEVEEERFSSTPTFREGLHHLQKKLLLPEKKESVMENSFDGSVISEMEGSDTVFTIERLTAALEAERKALRALYAELEEERSASAIAANQTMAMITRLQEEKAAMQMEALQYQRMMEEQSEYDQEALQLLNELMIKREKEKQELEKELEIHRKKVLDYESKEKMMRRRKDVGSIRNSSFCGHQERNGNSTPGDATLDLDEMGLECVNHLSTLEESLAEFEEERMCILEQLKALEEKLFTLGDDEQFFEDVEQMEQFPEHNGKDGKQYSEKKTKGSNAKSLLPLFDAIHIESEEGVLEEVHVESDSARMLVSSVSQFELEHKKLAIEEEVDHVYERLQALEADREFMKHCISSLKKGDKGMDLLQEILQHLRDLRTVEVRVRNMGDTTLI